jgi:LysR family transcriptional regulator, low CO2-responsive transcriptional regulator
MSEFLPDLRQLRAFMAIVQEGSFTIAAKKLHLTQSAISHSLRALEDQLNCKLLNRSGKKTIPTFEGENFYKRVVVVLHELSLAARECDEMKHSAQSRLRIGAPASLSQYLLPTVLREFRESFPTCEISIVTGDTVFLLEKMVTHELDLVLGMELEGNPKIVFRHLFTDELCFVVAPMHPWTKTNKITSEMLQQASFISYNKATQTHHLLEGAMKEMNVSMKNFLFLGDMEVIKQMVQAGLGVGIVSSWVAHKEVASGLLHGISIRCNDGEKLLRKWGVFVYKSREATLVEEVFIGICEMQGCYLGSR